METTARIVNDLNDYLTEAVKSTTSDLNLAMNTDSLSTTTDPTNSSISQDGNPTVFRATITSIYILIFVVGLVGNIITCTVIKRNKSMHTATNYYLFNLAITDMLILVSVMPFDVYSTWYPSQYPATGSVCVLQGLIAETSTNVVILTISCFTIERYIAICHPFRQQAMSKLSRAIKFIMGIWVASFLTALPQSSQFGLVDIKGHVYCTVDSQDNIFTFAMSTLIFFVSPMTLICVLYVLIGLKLQQSSRVMAKFSHRANRPSANNNHINNAVVQGGSQSRSGQKAKDSTLASVTYGPVERQHQPSGSGSRKSQRRIIKLLSKLSLFMSLHWKIKIQLVLMNCRLHCAESCRCSCCGRLLLLVLGSLPRSETAECFWHRRE